MIRIIKVLSLFVLAGSLVLACGPTEPEEFSEEEETVGGGGAPVGQPNFGGGDESLVKVQFGVNSQADGFSLLTTAASDWTVDVTGCASGYTATGLTKANHDADGGIELYLHDQDCVIELVDFDYDFDGDATPETYNTSNAGGVAFSDFDDHGTTGEEAQYSDGTTILWVRVKSAMVQEISSPTTYTVEYVFSELNAGTNNDVLTEADVSDPHSVTVEGVAAPGFTLELAELTDIDANGAGSWQFTFDCVAAMSETAHTSADSSTCEGLALSDMDYILVDDTISDDTDDAGGDENDGITLDELDTIFGGSPTTIDDDNVLLTSDADPHGIIDNGGFETDALQGPDTLHDDLDMLLIIRYVDPTEATNAGYIYFEIDIDPVSQ